MALADFQSTRAEDHVVQIADPSRSVNGVVPTLDVVAQAQPTVKEAQRILGQAQTGIVDLALINAAIARLRLLGVAEVLSYPIDSISTSASVDGSIDPAAWAAIVLVANSQDADPSDRLTTTVRFPTATGAPSRTPLFGQLAVDPLTADERVFPAWAKWAAGAVLLGVVVMILYMTLTTKNPRLSEPDPAYA